MNKDKLYKNLVGRGYRKNLVEDVVQSGLAEEICIAIGLPKSVLRVIFGPQNLPLGRGARQRDIFIGWKSSRRLNAFKWWIRRALDEVPEKEMPLGTKDTIFNSLASLQTELQELQLACGFDPSDFET